MTGNEAIRMLKAAGFRHVRTDRSGHSHYELGRHRIMVSPGSQDIKDASTAQRIEKLCRGDLTARDLQREAHQQKGELPNGLLRPGDRVTHTEDPSRGAGTVHTVDWGGARTATVEWNSFTSKNVPIGQLRIVQGEEGTMPLEEPVEIEEVDGELDIGPPPEEKKVPGNRTLLDELKDFELVAEIEYSELAIMRETLLERVAAYERVYSLREQLGIKMQKLPWKVVAEYPRTVPVTVEVEIPAVIEGRKVPSPPLVTAEVPVQRRDSGQILLDHIREHGGSISKMSVGHLKIIPDVNRHLIELTQSGQLIYTTEPDKAGREIGRWTIAGR